MSICDGFQLIYAAIEEARREHHFQNHTKSIFSGYTVKNIHKNHHATRGHPVYESFVDSVTNFSVQIGDVLCGKTGLISLFVQS